MASTKIVITLGPEEYKTLRNELVKAKEQQAEISKPGAQFSPEERREAGKRTMALDALLKEI